MEYLLLGFITGLSLILAIGAQNIFVIEQGLKKQHIFLVCLVCSLSDLILIFFGIFLFHYFVQYFNPVIELTLNILLIIFLLHFIYSKIKIYNSSVKLNKKIPKKINNKSDNEHIKQTKNTCCFFSPCSITKIFWAPIAQIKLIPVKKPNTRYSI